MAESNILPEATKIGFIGFGNIVVPLVSGWLRSKSVRPDQIIGSCLSEQTAERIRGKFGIKMLLSNSELVEACDVVFVAVKPHLVQPVLQAIQNWNPSRHLVVSLSACITIASYQCILPEGARVVRLALNTSSGVLACASAMALSANVTAEESSLVQGLMGSVGTCLSVEEKHIDTVSSMCGCGVAYLLLVAEALADGGLEAGLKKGVGIKLAAQTLIGAGLSILECGDTHVSQLRDNVCSPGGITIRGLHSLEKNGVRNAFLDAVELGVNTHAEFAKKFVVNKD